MTDGLKRVLGWLLAAMMGALVLDVLWGVFSRFVLQNAAQWTDEMAQLLVVWVAMVGAGLAYIERQHLAVDLLPPALLPDARPWIAAFSDLLVAVFAGVVMVYGGGVLTAQRFASGQILPALGISRGWVYLAIPVGGLLIAVAAAISTFTHRRKTGPATPVINPDL